MTPDVILVMGVAGSGKTTIGRALAAALDADFLEADDYHPAANVERMLQGIPLGDAQREPWLHAVHAAILERTSSGRREVVACSALKAAYRDVLLAGIRAAATVHLRVDRATLGRRLRDRRGHFMPVALLDSQLRDLEPPEAAIVVDAGRPVDEVVGQVLVALQATGEAYRAPTVQ